MMVFELLVIDNTDAIKIEYATMSARINPNKGIIFVERPTISEIKPNTMNIPKS